MITRLSFRNNDNCKMSNYSRREDLSLSLYRNHRDAFLSLYDGDHYIRYHEDMISDYDINIDSLAYSVSSSGRMLCGYDIGEDEDRYE